MSGEFEQVLSMGDKLGEHAGEWIAIVDGKIRASGNSAKEVYDKAKKEFPTRIPFIMKVPLENAVVI